MLSLNHNYMTLQSANTLNRQYGRLASSVQRLSSGLRINSAADDAAGLAIRELMRVDTDAILQGVRNANDAISMLQVADAALGIIDEKLIRMKELAEQAATGTYDSTQRLLIESEYQAMASEIDRIANATAFNGIKLLDGSLSGKHNGSGLTPSGAMKIHFGTGNDSAEDYYYVEIGRCTAGALGLGTNSPYRTQGISYIKVEKEGEVPQTFSQKTSYPEYIDPITGQTYYKDGDKFYSNIDNPAGSYLDETVDRVIIERLSLQQDVKTSVFYYDVLIDPQDNNTKYYKWTDGITADPNKPHETLDANDPADKEILDRLQGSQERVQVIFNWKVWEDPAGNNYYSINDGLTFVPDYLKPADGILDINNPADKKLIDTFQPVMTTKIIKQPQINITWLGYIDNVTSTEYYSADGGKTFVLKTWDPEGTRLTDKNIIDRLDFLPMTDTVWLHYDIYYDPDTIDPNTNNFKEYYTKDRAQTFVTDVIQPEDVTDAALIARLKPKIMKYDSTIQCEVYEDINNGNKRYYSMDGGQTFFEDLADFAGSTLDPNNPGDAATIAAIKNNKVDAYVNLVLRWDAYIDTKTNIRYYTRDGGNTFVRNRNNPQDFVLDPAIPSHKDVLDRLYPDCHRKSNTRKTTRYVDPNTGALYYLPPDGNGDIYVDHSSNVVLDRNNPAEGVIIDRLQVAQYRTTSTYTVSFPEKYYVYEDVRTGKIYYSPDNGTTFTTSTTDPYASKNILNPNTPSDKAILDNLQQKMTQGTIVEYVAQLDPNAVPAPGYTISTQEAAQKSLVAIDRAITSKDKIRAHIGALQNRLENTVANLNIQRENLLTAESRISDTDVAREMTLFVRNQVLTQSAVAMLSQANSFPHMLMRLLS